MRPVSTEFSALLLLENLSSAEKSLPAIPPSNIGLIHEKCSKKNQDAPVNYIDEIVSQRVRFA